MKMAMKDGQILIREADNVQFTIIKSWGKMKWSRQTPVSYTHLTLPTNSLV